MVRSLSFFFLFLLVPSLADGGTSIKNDEYCKASRCHRNGPEIRFPFRFNHQPRHCGYPGFEVSCKANKTVLHLPTQSGELYITAISYEYDRLTVVNPYNCFMDFVFHLNPSSSNLVYSSYCFLSTRFMQYFRRTREITFVECSNHLMTNKYEVPDFIRIPCMCQGKNQVYMADSSYDWGMLPSNCQKLKSFSTPFMEQSNFYSHEGCIDDTSNTVSLTWVLPGCEYCSWDGGRCQFVSQTTNETHCFYETSPPALLEPPYHDHENHKGISKIYVITGVVLSPIIIILASVALYKIHQNQKSSRERMEDQKRVDKFLEDYKSLMPTRYRYADIKRMTNHWKSKLGEGGYGNVFKGKLPNDTLVAVKVLKISTADGEDFINEVRTIGKIHNINVVRLLGFCADGFNRALIYEFMPNESLDKFIFSKEGKKDLLTWEILEDIAIGIARGIEYLHQGCDQRILHFDIKPSNILLDQNFTPKISDFGLAKLCSKEKSIVSMTAVRGTMGYIAPEILSTNCRNVSCKSDIYSFGMLLLEMVGGRKNIDADVKNASQIYFPEWIYNQVNKGKDLRINISLEEEADIAKKLTIVALWCIQWYPVDRPPMKKVIMMLQENVESLVMPPNPFVAEDTQDMKVTTVVERQTTNLEVILE